MLPGSTVWRHAYEQVTASDAAPTENEVAHEVLNPQAATVGLPLVCYGRAHHIRRDNLGIAIQHDAAEEVAIFAWGGEKLWHPHHLALDHDINVSARIRLRQLGCPQLRPDPLRI